MEKLIKENLKQAIPFAFRISGNLIRTAEGASVRAVAKILAKKKVGAVIVEKTGKLVGIISERDIVWRVVALGRSPDKLKAKDIMTAKVVSVDLNEGMEKVYETMSTARFRHLPVRKGDRVIGMVSTRDLMFLRKLKLAK
ncbi:MAG: CBS domain-containing protein [Candidatus Omnitrophica bacterium]|nr:CBS domain-containing protein [Candidatus Omnitrophota bacterium]